MRGIRGRRRSARGAVTRGSVGEAILRLAVAGTDPDELLAKLSIEPVLTAHPTEARRRTALIALRRIERLVERLHDLHLTPEEDGDIRRRLREEITLLWQTADLRGEAPSPLDEVRSALAFFDTTLFTAVPRLYRSVDAALDLLSPPSDARAASDSGRTGTRPPRVPPFLHLGSWVGGDRDGNPYVTAEVTAQTLRIASDHVLRGYEAVCSRLMQTFAAAVPPDRLSDRLAARLVSDEETLPETMRMLRRRFPDEPFRQRLGAMAEHLRRTRGVLTEARMPHAGRYDSVERTPRGAVRALRRADRDRPCARRLGRAGRPALAGRDVRLLPRLARDPTARSGPRVGPGDHPRGRGPAGRAGRGARRQRCRGPRHPPRHGRHPTPISASRPVAAT